MKGMNMISRRSLFAPLLTLATAGCGDSVIGRITRASNILAGDTGTAYNLEEARALPYASMDVKLGLSPNSLVILGRYSDSDLHWITADKVTLVTRQGRIIQTGALPNDLVKTQFWTPDPIVDRLPALGHSLRMLDLEYRSLYGLAIDSQWQSLGYQDTDHFGQVMKFEKIVERCSARNFNWEFENIYWRDEKQILWQSTQYYTPDAPALIIKVIKQG
jgi:hypothetical protein